MATAFDSARRETIPRALEVRLALGRVAETLALWRHGMEIDPNGLQEVAKLLEIAADPAAGGSVAEQNDRAGVRAALGVDETGAVDAFRSLACGLRAAREASAPPDPEELARLQAWVVRLRRAAAAARVAPVGGGARRSSAAATATAAAAMATAERSRA